MFMVVNHKWEKNQKNYLRPCVLYINELQLYDTQNRADMAFLLHIVSILFLSTPRSTNVVTGRFIKNEANDDKALLRTLSLF